jgi:DNA-binding PadR family transcriptional regulator
MTTFERAVLEVLSRSSDALGWYQIERRLSNMSLSERPHLPPVLEKLGQLGLVREAQFESEPLTRYVITPSGQRALNG